MYNEGETNRRRNGYGRGRRGKSLKLFVIKLSGKVGFMFGLGNGLRLNYKPNRKIWSTQTKNG